MPISVWLSVISLVIFLIGTIVLSEKNIVLNGLKNTLLYLTPLYLTSIFSILGFVFDNDTIRLFYSGIYRGVPMYSKVLSISIVLFVGLTIVIGFLIKKDINSKVKINNENEDLNKKKKGN